MKGEFKSLFSYRWYCFWSRFADVPYSNIHYLLIRYDNNGKFATIDEILVNCNPSTSKNIHINVPTEMVYFNKFYDDFIEMF